MRAIINKKMRKNKTFLELKILTNSSTTRKENDGDQEKKDPLNK